MPRSTLRCAVAVLAASLVASGQAAESNVYDVVVHGGTPAAITAAIAADRLGMRTALVSPDEHLGGMTTSGLGWTDTKDASAIGGLAREFYHRIWKHYRDPAAWTRAGRESYKSVIAQDGPAIDDGNEVMWTFEPHVAEKVIEDWLAETGVKVYLDHRLDRENGVAVRDRRIQAIRTLSGDIFAGKVFVDGTYEGDLMAAAGVSWRMGRDPVSKYDETLNGIYFEKPGAKYYKDDRYEGVSPYVVPDSPSSGFIAGIEGEMPPGENEGDGDRRLQSFNFRLCLTSDPENRVPIGKPEGYDEKDYELLLRLYEAGQPSGFGKTPMPNAKTDSNDWGMMSLDFVGGNFSEEEGWNYSDASYAKREEIGEAHRKYIHGLLWTIMNHPRVPEKDRREWAEFGLAKDEFADNDHWPRQMYVREARRMDGVDTVTQHHVERKPGYEVKDSIGLGSYSLDSHVVRRVVIGGTIRNEGGFYVWWDKAYPIGFGAIVPNPDEIRNLLVPVTLSATHAAFGSIRMEPTYMILGESAGTAAALAVKGGLAVQDVPYEELSEQLLADGQVLEPAK